MVAVRPLGPSAQGTGAKEDAMKQFHFVFSILQRAMTFEGNVVIWEASEEKARAYVGSLFAEKAQPRIQLVEPGTD